MTRQAKVYLVGAGSGDPELLTVKAVRLLQEADVVVYDRLISPEIIALLPISTRQIYVGKQCGQHAMSQNRINQLLVDLAQQHFNVVRLKGGDPYIFGRGSEEALHLAHNGIDFEVVPGITAASACSAYSGIPLTHRGLARSVEFITGHFREDQTLSFDWQRFSDPQLTLVFYMGLNNLPLICEQLIAAGRNADTPAAVIENGSTLQQRRLVSTLQYLPSAAKRGAFQSPSLIIVGDVVTLSDELDWFGRLNTGDREQSYASVG